MKKIAVFDTGFGGELFADRLEAELSIVEVIRVIAWRHAVRIEQHPREARRISEEVLRPYIGNVDLLVIANYQISATSLSYLRRKYPRQKFVGFTMRPKRITNRPTLILTTRATTKNLAYLALVCSLMSEHSKFKTICLNHWPHLIDNGELTSNDFQIDLEPLVRDFKRFPSPQIILTCSQFTECIPKFRQIFGHNARIIDSFDDTIHDIYKTLNLSGKPKTAK